MVLLLAAGAATGTAQVVLDGKFGTSGPLAGPSYSITDGMGATRGNNLFQSFAQFNLVAGDVATFTGPANIQNILSRVTGGSASSINGTIRSGIVGANFFFINPSGVMFGPNAVVDVSGSFAASTANYLKLADGARFVAALDADDSGLSTAPVSAFGFLGDRPGSIAVQQSTLRVPNLKTIALVGGDITVDRGAVLSAGGQINMVSVQSAGEVPVDPQTLSVADFNAAFPRQGEITLKNGAQLNANGIGGGRIVIRGGRLLVDNTKIQANTTGATAGQGIDIAVASDLNLVNGGQITSLSTSGSGAGGNINVTAQSIRLDGGGLVDQSFRPTTQISTTSGSPSLGGGTARGGDIVIQTGSLELVNSAQISSATYNAGNAGRIEITAASVRLDAQLTTLAEISANTWKTSGGGSAGDIVIRTGTLDLLNGATLLAASFGTGRAGIIDISAQSINLLSGAIMTAGTFGSGSGGNIQIKCDLLRIDGQDTLTGGPDFLTGIQAVTTSSYSPAPGGSIHITAGAVELDHLGSIFTTSYGLGSGGNIEVTAENLKLAHGSTIRAEGLAAGPAGGILLRADQNVLLTDGSGVSTSALDGSGGNIDVTAQNLTLANGSTIRAEGLAAGPAGGISLRADQNVLLTGGSTVSTSALESSGGDINVRAGVDIQLTDSKITAQAGPGGGGNIALVAPALIYLLASTVTAEARGDGGNLTIDPVFFVMNQSALISRSSSANGGNITILSDYFFQSSSLIDSSAPFGLPGTVSVAAPDLDLSGSLVGLPSNLLDIEAQLRPDCRVRLAGNLSSFIVLGRGGLPLAPGGFVPSGAGSPLDEKR